MNEIFGYIFTTIFIILFLILIIYCPIRFAMLRAEQKKLDKEMLKIINEWEKVLKNE